MNPRAVLDILRQRLNHWGRQLANAWQRARTQQVDLSSVKNAIRGLADTLRQRLRQRPSFSVTTLRLWLQLHGRKLALMVGAPLLGIAMLILVNQQTSRLSNSLALKPVQLHLIESLIQESKQNNRSGNAAVAPLTDNDLETMRVILQNRGINTNILRLNLEQGVRIEIQIDQAPFGQWIAFLEEIAQRWQVYPTQLTLQANDQPEVVSIRGTLQQSQGGMP